MTTDTAPTTNKMPEIGDSILYVMEDGPNAGKVRPSLILSVNESSGLATENSPPASMTCNLVVFTDFENDGPQYRTGPAWKTAVPFSNMEEPRTWHYPDTVILSAPNFGIALTGGRGGDSALL